MIKRVTDPEEFRKATHQIFDLLEVDSEENKWHHLLPNNRQSIIQAFAHKSLLVNDVFAWVNVNEKQQYDSCIIFIRNQNERYGKEIFSEHTWLSGNPRVGLKLFKTAINFAIEKGFEYISVGCSVKSPNSESVRRFYERMGFLKDTETYIAKI